MHSAVNEFFHFALKRYFISKTVRCFWCTCIPLILISTITLLKGEELRDHIYHISHTAEEFKAENEVITGTFNENMIVARIEHFIFSLQHRVIEVQCSYTENIFNDGKSAQIFVFWHCLQHCNVNIYESTHT
jgi:hypothetical protein